MAALPTATPPLLSAPVLRRVALHAAPALALLALLVALLYVQDRSWVREQAAWQARTRVDHRAERLGRELVAAWADLDYLARRADLRRLLSDGSGGDAVARDLRRLATATGTYQQIRLLDATGQEQVRIEHGVNGATVSPTAALQSKADRYYFRETWAQPPGQVFASRFDLNEERGEIQRPWQPVFRVATVVTDLDDRPAGVLVLNRRGDELLDQLALPSGPASAQAYLVDRDGYYLQGPDPERSWGFQLGRPPTFSADHPDTWGLIQQADVGQHTGADGLLSWGRVALPPGHGPGEASGLALWVVDLVPTAALVSGPQATLRRLVLLALLAAVLLLGLAWAVAVSAEARARQERALAASASRLRALTERLLTTGERERKALSRELHDGAGQLLTAVNLTLQRTRRAEDGPARQALLAQAEAGTQALRQCLHDLATSLRPSVLDDVGLEEAARVHLDAWERATGICPRLVADLDGAVLGAGTRDHAFRILQEALSNVARHTDVDEVSVALVADGQTLSVVVRDDGPGFDPGAVDPERLGLVGMRERAELLGGSVRLRTSPGLGTEVAVSLPLPGPVS